MEIEIIVREKVARLANKHDFAVCGNSDYKIKFDFDSEWDAYEVKTTRFKYNGTYTDVVFNGCECPMPIITGAFRVEVGVYAGDLRTTSCAVLPLKKSILCGSETESKESQEIKDSINKILKEKIDSPQKAVVGEVLTVEEVDEDGKPTKWKTAPAAAEQKQADLGQNDETAADFVRNRPCYTEWKAGTYLEAALEKETAIYDGLSYYSIGDLINGEMYDLTDYDLFVEGRKYNIVFDGVVYISCARKLYGRDCIGNTHLIYEDDEDNGMPFAMNDDKLVCITAGSHNIKVTGEVPIYHKLDERYYNRTITFAEGLMGEKPSEMLIAGYNTSYSKGKVYWDFAGEKPTDEEFEKLGDDIFKFYPVTLRVYGMEGTILGGIPYGKDSPLIIEFPANVGETKGYKIAEAPNFSGSSYDTNQYMIKMMEKSVADGAKNQTFNIWFNNYETRYGRRYALLYYNDALYNMELRFNSNANPNLKIKRIL